MPNMFDYLKWRGDIKLWQSGFCNVDALIMTELAYINHDGIVPEKFEDGLVTLADEARRYNVLHRGEKLTLGAIVPVELIDLFFAASATERFSGIGICGYVNLVDDSAVFRYDGKALRRHCVRQLSRYR